MLRCSAIIVTYNSAETIGACLEALAREDCEIVVVDNASQDDTVQRVEEFVAWHELRLLANDSNLGFAAAVNQGAREATGDVLLLLNPDAIAEAGSGESSAAVHGSKPRSGCWRRAAAELTDNRREASLFGGCRRWQLCFARSC